MGIKLVNPRQDKATPERVIQEVIKIGKKYRDAAEGSEFYKELRVNHKIAETIRDCNNFLGMGGNFKNGCLYREKGLDDFWKRGNGEEVVCDHAVPVTELVKQHKDDEVPIQILIFSPVVRITKASNNKLTKYGKAKTGHKMGFPLYRYSHIEGMRIVTHQGVEIPSLKKWTDGEHWELIHSTEELKNVLHELGLDNYMPQ